MASKRARVLYVWRTGQSAMGYFASLDHPEIEATYIRGFWRHRTHDDLRYIRFCSGEAARLIGHPLRDGQLAVIPLDRPGPAIIYGISTRPSTLEVD